MPRDVIGKLTMGTTDVQSYDDIRAHIVAALADVRVTDTAAIEWEIGANGGDLVIDSLEGLNVIVDLETWLGRDLPGAEDLDPAHYTSIASLTALVAHKLREG